MFDDVPLSMAQVTSFTLVWIKMLYLMALGPLGLVTSFTLVWIKI